MSLLKGVESILLGKYRLKKHWKFAGNSLLGKIKVHILEWIFVPTKNVI